MTDKPLAKRKPNELRDLIEGQDFRAQLLKALPKSLTPERFVRITVTAMMRNSKLMQCDRDSFFRCILDLAAIGLEPDGRQAHLIPRFNKDRGVTECTLNVDYKGYKELLYRNQDIIDEHSDVVGDMDLFDYEFGSNKHLTHKPNVHSRGRIFCAYSYITLPKGGAVFDVMSTEEIEAIRKRSASPTKGPWATDWSEMAKKTVFRRLSKGLPLSPKTRDAMALDQDYDAIEAATPMTPPRAVVGGAGRAFPDEGRAYPLEDEEEDSSSESAANADESAATIPPDAPQSPPERVSAESKPDKPEGPLIVVRRRLKEAGFKPEELLVLLKTVRLVNSSVKDLGMCPPQALHSALEDWDSCITRLKQERDAAKNPPQAEPEDFPV